MTAKETSAYIKGIIEGANFDTTTTEGKIINALVDLCQKMAEEIEELQEDVDTAFDYLDELDEDLGAVEEIIYDELDDCDCDCDDDDCDCDCCDCDDDDCDCCDCCDCDDEDETEFYVAMCPNCNGKVYFDDTMDPKDVVCPQCQKPLVEDEDILD
ncbi:MAG: hypothetical protein E7627_05325 [Ruminococcaceae bacterium]|nr:hypothetical protein [Oscillospiraceae bacterium]